MMRKILTIVLPLALPVVIYWIYLALARRRVRRTGEGKPPDWQDAPWTVILAASVVLMSASLIAYGIFEGHDAGTASTIVSSSERGPKRSSRSPRDSG